MKFRSILLFIFISQSAAFGAPGPIDRVQEEMLKARKSKAAREIAAAYRTLAEQKWDAALSKARAARKYVDFADYAYWIEGTAQLRRAERAISRKRLAEAVELANGSMTAYLEVVRHGPYSPFIKEIPVQIAAAEILSADASVELKKWAVALGHYERAFQRLSDARKLSTLRPEILGRFSDSCVKAKSSLCVSWIQKLSSSFPKASEEAKIIARRYSEPLDIARPPRFERSTQAYRAPDKDAVALDAAMEKIRAREFDDAVTALRGFLDEFPRSVFRWRAQYWLGRALKEEGEDEAAATQFEQLLVGSPLSYYGILASVEIGKDPESLIAATLPSASATDPFLSPDEVFALRRAEQFIAEKELDLAAGELREFRARSQHSSAFLTYLAVLQHMARNYSVSFSVISELIQRGYDGVATSYMLRLIFPVEYMELIRRFSKEHGVDPVLVLSLVKQESGFNADAVSSAGASGLMQLMPATAVDTIAGTLRSDLSDEEANIRVGTKYLSQLLRRFNGNIVLSLAGYNAGPGAVDRWLREPPLKPGMLDFIEAIPYRETREYVSSIIRNYFWYSRRLEDAAKKPIEYFWQVAGPSPSPAPAQAPVVLPAAVASPVPLVSPVPAASSVSDSN